ncbi:hypothetical protein EI94DRAFT_1714341 [Lactarius quietus]|nr:hypothetical protein EI94DRAFT_1714341 [Lactarius quietus]
MAFGTAPTVLYDALSRFSRRFLSRSNVVPKHGKSLIVQLEQNGMKLQQCLPSFFDARDAIIQADQVLTGGENFREWWSALRRKGCRRSGRVPR